MEDLINADIEAQRDTMPSLTGVADAAFMSIVGLTIWQSRLLSLLNISSVKSS